MIRKSRAVYENRLAIYELSGRPDYCAIVNFADCTRLCPLTRSFTRTSRVYSPGFNWLEFNKRIRVKRWPESLLPRQSSGLFAISFPSFINAYSTSTDGRRVV